MNEAISVHRFSKRYAFAAKHPNAVVESANTEAYKQFMMRGEQL